MLLPFGLFLILLYGETRLAKGNAKMIVPDAKTVKETETPPGTVSDASYLYDCTALHGGILLANQQIKQDDK